LKFFVETVKDETAKENVESSFFKTDLPSQSVIDQKEPFACILFRSMNSNSLVQVYEKVKADYVKNSTMKSQVRLSLPK
jgi:hypothetical protein